MKITVTGRKIHITDGIRDHLNRKMNKKITNLDDETDIHVSLSVEKYRHFAEFTVKKRGLSFYSHDETNDLYASMDKALEKMEKQLLKHKGKLKNLRLKKGSNSKNQILN